MNNNISNFSNSKKTITNTATLQGYYTTWNDGNTVMISDEDSYTLDCIFADIVKTADKEQVSTNEDLTYYITFKNLSSSDMYNVKIVDDLPPYVTLKENGISPRPKEGETLETGVTLGNVQAGKEKTLTVKVKTNSDAFGDIVNRAYADFCFYDKEGAMQCASTHITSVTTSVDSGSVTIEKSADKDYVTSMGETVIYTLTVNNSSPYTIQDVVITDNLPSGLEYVENSTVINGEMPIDSNPTGGIYLGDMPSGSIYTVQFSAKVNN